MRFPRPFVLLALAALLAPRAEASRTSGWESNPPASIGRAEAAASLAPAAATDIEAEEPPRFDLGDVVLVDTATADAERFHLGPLPLVDLNLLRGPPPSYPETRVGGFELLPPFRVGASPSLSLWSRQACGAFSCGVASDSPEDPWGLQSAPTPVPCPVPAPGHGCFEGSVSTGSSFSLTGDRGGYVKNLQKAGLGTQQTQKLANEKFPISSGEKARYTALRGGIQPLQVPVEMIAAIELFALTGFVPMEAAGPLVLIGSGSEMAAQAEMGRRAAALARLSGIRGGGIGSKGKLLENYLTATKAEEASAVLNVQRANGTGFDLVTVENGTTYINEAKFVEGQVSASDVTALGLHNVGRTTGGNLRFAANRAEMAEMLDVARALRQKDVTVRFVGGPSTTWDEAEIIRRLSEQGFNRVEFQNVTAEQLLQFIAKQGAP